MKKIDYKDLTDFSREYTHHSVSVYSLNIDITEEPFGYFFVDNRASTLAWNGTLDFGSLNDTVLQAIPYRIHREMVDWSEVIKSTTASFVLAPNELVEYELKYPRRRADYERVLRHSNSILFARYDVHGGLGLPFDYSFTAENPLLPNSDQGELAIRLPNPEDWTPTLWTPALLEWITQHHSASSTLAGNVHWEASSKTLEFLSTRIATLQPS